MITDDQPLLQILAVLVAAVGALNWGTIELLDLDLLTAVGLSGDLLMFATLAIGAAGAIVLVDMLEIVGDEGGSATPLED